MADNNTLNFDLDAPAVPTLTLDPTPEAAEEKKPEPAPAAQQPEVQLTPEEQAMVDSFAEKIDITNSQQVLQYGSACQKKIGDFSEAALAKVSTKDLGEVGDMITNLIGELKSFDANEEQQKGILGFFKKKSNELDNLKTKYNIHVKDFLSSRLRSELDQGQNYCNHRLRLSGSRTCAEPEGFRLQRNHRSVRGLQVLGPCC